MPQQHQFRPRSDVSAGDITGIVGVVFGVSAFIFAIYQFRYNIFLSGKLRDKCSNGAIGNWARLVKFRNRFVLPGRRTVVDFPLLQFTVSEVLQYRNAANDIQSALVRASWANLLSCLDV